MSLSLILKSRKGWVDSLKEIFEAVPKLRPKVSTQFDVNTGQPSFDFTLDMATSSEFDLSFHLQRPITLPLALHVLVIGNSLITNNEIFE